MMGIKSDITSFRSNRFNNFFEVAAALHFHRLALQKCLKTLPKLNKKLQGVLADTMDDNIDCCLIALGILFYRVTGLFWVLLGQGIHCLDLYQHVEKMYNFFRDWSHDPADAF